MVLPRSANFISVRTLAAMRRRINLHNSLDYRAVFESRLDDERSDDEDDGEDEDAVDARRDD